MPGPWVGYTPREARKRSATSSTANFMQTRTPIHNAQGKAVLLQFSSPEARGVSSMIIAGASTVPDAISKIMAFEAQNGTIANGHSSIQVHNLVMSGDISVPLTLDALRALPCAVSSEKFPGMLLRQSSLCHKHTDGLLQVYRWSSSLAVNSRTTLQ